MTRCPICGALVDPPLLSTARALRPQIAILLARSHPGWIPEQGVCPACALRASHDFARTRSSGPIHGKTDPATTFPYYHADEETVLGWSERLPDYHTHTGQGVTLGFLDSGYYPHPDLSASPIVTPPTGQQWERLTAKQWRNLLSDAGTRLVDYIDLSGDRDERGLDLDSLWDGQGVAWHGQMTTVLAAGNGALSGGRYRGPAPEASVLPIKVGRGDGRIPESDILEGFAWLLANQRWERYGVRVLNVSVGGDFPQDWRINPVCQAAERLTDRGMLVVAAAGNRPLGELLAPAQAPSVLTVGGVDDWNRRINPQRAELPSELDLYHHNFGSVRGHSGPRPKPDILAPATYLPGPILPISPVFREMQAIARLRRTLRGGDADAIHQTDELLAHWQRVLHGDLPSEEESTGEWMAEVWQAVRKRMNANKWVHGCYQHVDGTSVAAAVVSGVAAQMVQANPHLSGAEVRALLCATALPLPHLPADKQGAGLIQPAAAVAAALRARGGSLSAYPRSATVIRRSELHKWAERFRVPTPVSSGGPDSQPMYETELSAGHTAEYAAYFGLLAQQAQRVWLVGDMNSWRIGAAPLHPATNGWWHALLPLENGDYLYRFWVEWADGSQGWLVDPETQLRAEGGYLDAHSRVLVGPA